jgi:long-subunit acyl-CoA synthetase (AMP-forming)
MSVLFFTIPTQKSCSLKTSPSFVKLTAVFSRDSKLRRPEKVVLIESAPASEIPTSGMTLTATTLLDELQVKGSQALKASPTLFELAVDEVRIEDVATIIYTSGTTGRPKGVVHTHAQVLSEVAEAFPLLGVSSNDVTLTFLPFAHVLGRIEIWGHALLGFTMGFAVSFDRLKADFQEIRPTIIVAVPRVFEKIHAGILSQAEISPMRRKVFDWALAVGRAVSLCKQEKRAIPLETAIQYAGARKLVFDSIQERLGGRLRFAVCGGAPLSREIAEFFHAAGLLILEGYGLTEHDSCSLCEHPVRLSIRNRREANWRC